MATVESTITIAAPVESVYAIARDVERFPEFMDDVQDVEILEEAGERRVSHWVGLIEEFNRTLEWTEEDFWDHEEYSCRFEMIEGDFTAYSGTWTFEEVEEGTLAKLVVDYEYAIPLIGPLIKKLLHRKVQDNCDNMLAAIKQKAEKD
ncbi:MAG: type II toxin-antitoxin system RatA family toxin [Armatimonadota bacterium]